MHRLYKNNVVRLAIPSLLLLTVLFSGYPGNISLVAAQDGQPAQLPQQGQAQVGQPASMNPSALPSASAPSQQSSRETNPFFTKDRRTFTIEKRRANRETAVPSSAAPSDEPGDAADAGAGPSNVTPEEITSGPSPSDPTGTSSTNFTGIDENGWIPPDTNIAAGPSDLVEVVNAEVAVFGKTGSTLVGPTTLQAWFGRAAADRIFDPVVVYRGGRFYIVALFRNTTTQVSEILISASTTSSGAGGWCNYSINGEQASTNWADFPRVGITKDRILIATNQFTWSGNAFEQNFLQVIPKAPVDACAGFSYNFWFGFFDSNGSLGFTLNPALDYDDFSTTAFYLVNSLFPGGNFVTVWRHNISAGSWTRFNVGTQTYSLPPDARQPGTATRIETNDSRILHAVKRYNRLWAFHTSGLNPSCSANIAAIHVVAINAPASTTTAPTLQHDVMYHAGCTLDLYYPAGTPDGNGNMLMMFNRSSTTERPNIRFTGWHAANFPAQTLFAGGGGYFASKTLGTTPCACTETRGRWGDYSGISLDPTSTQQYVWIAGEILAANNSWTTRIGRIHHSPVPSAP